MSRKLTASSLLLCLLVVCSAADQPKKLHFVSSDSINLLQLIPDPPSAGSEEDREEIQQVLKLQQTRTDEQIARAQSEDKLTVFAFSDVLGASFTAGNCPKIATLFVEIDSDSKYFSKSAKEHWARPRPFVVEKKIKPVTNQEIEGSYPSGHATRGMLFAEVLAELYPDHRDALLERGRQIGWDRVIAGVHYPSDVAAGRVLGQNLSRLMLANPDFQLRLERVRSEASAPHHPTSAAASAR